MSLYTPVFPSVHGSGSSQRISPEDTSMALPGKQHSYVELVRDIHLFLSTKNDVLSPPSRPNSPLFDHRVQKVRDDINCTLSATGGETASGQWTRLSQTLKLGCTRGRYRSVPNVDPCPSDGNTTWILPDNESEWFEWEKKREENRRLGVKTNASQQVGSAASAPPDSPKPHSASVAILSRPVGKLRERPPRDVSPTTLCAAKEKVRMWQASVASEVWQSTTSGSSPGLVVTTDVAGQANRPQRSRTLDFTVVKSTAKLATGKKGKGSLLRPGVPGGSAPSPRLSRASTVSAAIVPTDETGPKGPFKPLHGKGTTPKIRDVPETPYLPPSFPAGLKTSTPLPDPKFVRTKPSPILPLPMSSSAPPLQTVVDPPDDRQVVPAEPHAANKTSSQPPQISTMHSGKRSRELSSSLDCAPANSRATPPAKRLQTSSHDRFAVVFRHSPPISPIGGLDLVPCDRDDARDTSLGATPSHQHNSHEMTSAAPLTPGKNDEPTMEGDIQGASVKIPSPAKSVKSYFSTPDSDTADSPMKANLLLESPVSPMLSYARNPSGFLPPFMSTQVGKDSPTAGLTNGGIFGMGYSSQVDVERYVDRVSELLEKDVDFDGWLRDVRTVEREEES